jgi:hypothetical protein
MFATSKVNNKGKVIKVYKPESRAQKRLQGCMKLGPKTPVAQTFQSAVSPVFQPAGLEKIRWAGPLPSPAD